MLNIEEKVIYSKYSPAEGFFKWNQRGLLGELHTDSTGIKFISQNGKSNLEISRDSVESVGVWKRGIWVYALYAILFSVAYTVSDSIFRYYLPTPSHPYNFSWNLILLSLVLWLVFGIIVNLMFYYFYNFSTVIVYKINGSNQEAYFTFLEKGKVPYTNSKQKIKFEELKNTLGIPR